MRQQIRTALTVLILSFVIVRCAKDRVTDPAPNDPVRPDLVFWGLTANNSLVKYNTNDPGTPLGMSLISGLPASEKILAIDFRPATGQLYGLGSNSRIFMINPETGAATLAGASFSPALAGSLAGFDFNPTVDRIRLVSSSGQNLRLHPETGAVVAVDGNSNPGMPAISAAAYTNSVAGAGSTTLYVIGQAEHKLYKQDPPNNGTLVEVGPLGIQSGNESGFDISPDNSVAIASFNVNGRNMLYQVDLMTGRASSLGVLSTPIIGLAIPSSPVAYAVDPMNNLQIFNPNNPGTPVNKAISGLQPGEMILGIDMRPATGQLYALGSSSRLYTINMSSGAAAAVSLNPFSTLLNGTSFGFDFNPAVDRIRVVSNTGQNLRLHPVTGDIAAVDGMLNPGTPQVSSAAYTNNFPGTTSTTLFVMDATTDKLYIQNPPNNGTLTETGNLGLDIGTENGFDIGGTSNKAWMIATHAGSTRIYSVNIQTGTATAGSSFPNSVRGFAVGLGF